MASFSCSKCRLPISLSPELANPSPTTYDLLRSASATPRPRSAHKAYPSSRESYLHDALTDSAATITSDSPPQSRLARPDSSTRRNGADSFVLLSQPEESGNSFGPGDSLSQNLENQRKLFDLLSEHSDIDHPLCNDCTEAMIQAMNKTMAELERDRKAYISYLNKAKGELPSREDHISAEAELEDLRHQEREALAELRMVEQERADMLVDLAQLEKENAALDEEEAEFWHDRNKFAAEVEAFKQERDSINLRYEHDAKQLERLQKTNVYNDTFNIGHDGNFGTINGLRLGRLPNHPVSWDEINAAWGLTILLLQTMAEKLEFTFRGYVLHPMGSTSRIEKVDLVNDDSTKSTSLELFGTTEINPLKLFQRNSFDKAMIAFLECLRQLGDFAETKDSSVVMPYKIDKDKISDACIRTAFNQDEGWTRALKFCLTNCKWILAVVAKTTKV